MDLIYIADLKVSTIIGCHAWERAIKQPVIFNLELAADVKSAAINDQINQTLNYDTLAKRITAFVEQSQCHLIETLAEQVAELILKEFKISWLRLKLAKPGAILNTREVGVVIERSLI